MKNKRNIIIIIVCLIVGIIFFIFFKGNSIVFSLNGDSTIVLKYGTTFIDPGFVAKNGFNKDISSNVIVSSNINEKVSGTYQVIYQLNYRNVNKQLIRNVIIGDIDASDIEIILNGGDKIYLLKDNTYQELGVYILNNITNEEIKENIVINSNVNTNEVGEYEVKYIYQNNGAIIEKIRKVLVFDINYVLDPSGKTPGKVSIKFDFNSLEKYQSIKLPNGETLKTKNVKYEVDKNNEYKFIISVNDREFEKVINIDNIIGEYACSGEVNGKGTTLKVVSTSTDNVKEYEWVTNIGNFKGQNTLINDKIIDKAIVNLIFNDNSRYQVNCSIKDSLVYRFKYDENNTKPFMKCNTYTAQDKTRLDAKLAQVVNEAGRGSRAGVVAAARFLVGGLDYKVPYEGGVYYNKGGLNIGQNGSWGCSGKGLDCYSFVAWARAQNGLPDDGFYNGTKHNTAADAANIKVGDYLLTPCSSSSCKNANKINHIGLVIGIDENYLYVAEETTGNINALVVTRLARNNLPRSGGFSLVRHVNYPSEGNVTNMWIS